MEPLDGWRAGGRRLDVLARAPSVLRDRRIREQLSRSWLRCRNEFSLEREMQRGPSCVGFDELNRRRRRIASLFTFAKLEMLALQELIPFTFVSTLTDTDGVIVTSAGDGNFAAQARSAGLHEGAVWTEAAQGTNGMGTCLAAGEPVLVLRDEHYLRQNAALSCCAAPIRDPRGVLLGSLNVSTPEVVSLKPLLALIVSAARSIEARLLLDCGVDAYVLRFHHLAACVTTAGEGLLLLDRTGRVRGINHAASLMLQEAGAVVALDEPVERVLSMTLANLQEVCRGNPWRPRLLVPLGLYGVLQPSGGSDQRCVDDERICIGEGALSKAERTALLEALKACEWNISQAARSLGLGRKTLYRKLRRHQLQRPC